MGSGVRLHEATEFANGANVSLISRTAPWPDLLILPSLILPSLYCKSFIVSVLAPSCPLGLVKMRLLLLVALLPALSLAENAFQHIFNDVKERVNEFTGSIPNPIDAGASKVAAQKVERINIRNLQRKLAPKPEREEEWMVYFTGGNKTCFGRCGPVDVKWNVRLSAR